MRSVRVLFCACLALVPVAAFAAGGSRPAMLTCVEGTVEVKGVGQAAWRKANLMALLSTGDTLRTGKASAATVVFFSDGHREKLLAQTSASVQSAALSGAPKRVIVPKGGKEPAPGSRCVVVLQGGPKLHVSRTSAAGRPGAVGLRELTDLCLLAPLGPKVRSGNPTFAWTSVTGAGKYHVVVRDETGAEILQKRVSGTRLTYPADSDPLAPRILYTWSVEAFSGEESLGKQESRFGVLAPSSLAAVRREEAALKQLGAKDATDTTSPILLARLYLEYGLSKEAIAQLERAVALKPNEWPLHQELGSLYRSVGWEAAAQRQLQRADELRLPSGDGGGSLP